MQTNQKLEHYEAIIIGSGKGGKTLAVDLGNHGVKTALIERDAAMIGGTCINLGCIPTKTFIASARLAHAARRGAEFGIHTGPVSTDWRAVQKRVEDIVVSMREMNRKNFTTAPQLDFILGTGRFIEPKIVEVRAEEGSARLLTAERIFIDTGTRPAVSNISGLADIGPLALNSDTVQKLPELPPRLLILGGGYIALEFAQMFQRFGSKVVVIERGAQLLGREDADAAEQVANILRADGIEIWLNTTVERVEKSADGLALTLQQNAQQKKITVSHLLTALGRTPVTKELNLSAAGVETDARGFIKVNDRLETNVPGIFAMGDVNGGPQFTHASLDDWRLLKTNVFGAGGRSTKDRLIPSTLFIEPELARIGLTEKEARAAGLDFRAAKMPAAAIPRARTTGNTAGFIKLIVELKTDRIIGCTILAENAGEMIAAAQMAMIAKLPWTALRDAPLTHPTMTEGFNYLLAAFKNE